MISDLFKWFTDPSLLALLFMTICVLIVVLNWHRTGKIDLSQVLVDSTSGKIAIEKVGYMTALATSTWGFIDLSLHDRLTEWYAGLYVGLLISGRVANTAINAYKDVKKNADSTAP